MKKIIISILLILTFSISPLYGQMKEHLIGFKAAYNISGVDFKPTMNEVSVTTFKNYSLVYLYYHDLWKTMPYFGFQASFSYQEQAYRIDDTETRLTCYEIPLVSQFHIDFWKMRFLINLGGFMGYRMASNQAFDSSDLRLDYGFIAGGGLAFVFKPLELHLEGNYQYSLSYLYNPRKFSDTDLQFSYPHQLLLSLALYLHL
ncbi:MAG: hypothetical protein A2X18_14120 [Bacteroidetes bacterium GWF2_40_14]|nr:MAG: hypothetical protein A2X18_14120 [Bacteroidetes bacterium GWF2_40_14]